MGEQRPAASGFRREQRDTGPASRPRPRKPARPANERIVGRRRGLFDETHDDEALPPRYSKTIEDNKCSSRARCNAKISSLFFFPSSADRGVAQSPPRRLRRLPIVRGAAPDRPVGY